MDQKRWQLCSEVQRPSYLHFGGNLSQTLSDGVRRNQSRQLYSAPEGENAIVTWCRAMICVDYIDHVLKNHHRAFNIQNMHDSST